MYDAVVSLSGGMDSTTVLAACKQQYARILAVSFRYTSKHNKYELESAYEVADFYKVDRKIVDLGNLFYNMKSDLLIGGGEVPEGHYDNRSMRRTVVPGRNLIFSSILAGIAWSEDAKEVWLGVHKGDALTYPDCRPAWFEGMKVAIREGTEFDFESPGVILRAPFLFKSKKEILEYGLGLTTKVPYELTRTCYKDHPVACGMCGSCQERLYSFSELGVIDPLVYTSRSLLPKE